MKKFFLLLPLLAGCASPLAFDKSVAGHRLPHHFIKGGCEQYATELNLALCLKRINSVHVAYAWKCNGTLGLHAVVLFRQDGRIFCMDEYRFAPKQVFGSTDLELLKSFSRFTYCMVDDRDQPAQPRTVEQLFGPLL